MIKAVRGTRDILPPETAVWNFVEEKVREVFRAYNFQEIRTPIFESTELFARGVGEDTDIVSKEMYTWQDRPRGTPISDAHLEGAAAVLGGGSQSLTLRPEATAGIMRAYIEHKLGDRGLNKLYCIGPMFRRERPQKGRYRQFYQIDAEVIGPPSSGSESPARDAEVIELIATLLDKLGIKGWNLELNSVGCPGDRAKFNEALRKALEPVVGQMCSDCQRRAVTNPLRVFDCKVPADQPIIEKLPRISQFLDEPCRKHFEEVQDILTKVGVDFRINDRLVRGLDYYTRTAFEFTHGALGAQNAILGGGRYDGLSESLGGPAAPGIGFAIGEDRLVMSLQETIGDVANEPDAYIAPLGPSMNGEAARLARELRRDNLVVDLGDENFRLKKSFEAATKAGAKYILIVGENEVKADAFALKNLATGEQVSVPRAGLAQKIRE
jgi:histidyl-tRNA synthetase